jgi:hypothetical protein
MTNGATTMTNAGAATTGRRALTPARWLVLLLGVPVLFALIAGTAFSAVAQFGQASFPVRDTIPVSGHRLTAQIDGNITLRQASAGVGQPGTAELTGTAHYTLIRAKVTETGDSVQFRCPLPINNCELNGTLQIPSSATAVSLATGGGDVTVPSLSGATLTLNTAGGNLTAGSLTGAVNLDTYGGDVTVSTFSGGPLNLTSGGGNLNVEDMTAPQATITSGGGDVALTFTTTPNDVLITSGGGNVALTVPRGLYKINYDSNGGNYSSSVGDDPQATNSITIDSGGGDISISEAS